MMNQPLCRQHHRSPLPLQSPTGLSADRSVTCRSKPAVRPHRAQLRVRSVAADKVSSTVAEIPKVKANKAKLGEMSPETAKDIYRDMYLGREFEEMCAQMYYRGKMFGFVHLYSGQEAVSTGVIRNLRKDDYICSTYRDHVHALSKNVPAKNIMAELFGKKTGICRGQGGSMHMFSAEHGLVSCTYVTHMPCHNQHTKFYTRTMQCCSCSVQLGGFAFIGEGIPIGLGAAYKIKYRRVSLRCIHLVWHHLSAALLHQALLLQEALHDEKADQVAVNFFGDGTANNGKPSNPFTCLHALSKVWWMKPVLGTAPIKACLFSSRSVPSTPSVPCSRTHTARACSGCMPVPSVAVACGLHSACLTALHANTLLLHGAATHDCH